VCEGLHAAHELTEDGQPLHLVHRDVSPQNVMIGYDGRVRLLDFGVAKIESENVTKTGEVKGKTAYMSPEQAMGEPLDRRSDLFGVGAILYECLALKRMWGEGTDMEVIRKLALEVPPPLEKAIPSPPPALSTLYATLVARDAEARPATAREAASAFRACASGGVEDLRAILDKHFGAQVKEQKERLAKALRDVAPDKAEELRESVMPVSEGRSPARAVEEEEPKPRATTPYLVGALAIVAVGVGIWKLTPANDPAPPARVVSTAPIVTETVSIAPVPPPPPSETASATTPATVAVKPPPPPPTPSVVPPRPTTSTSATTTIKPVSEKPLDVDPTPF
jgi:serine/threonine-protein kinase